MQKAGVYLAPNQFVSSSQGTAISVQSVFDKMIAALALSPIPAALGRRGNLRTDPGAYWGEGMGKLCHTSAFVCWACWSGCCASMWCVFCPARMKNLWLWL